MSRERRLAVRVASFPVRSWASTLPFAEQSHDIRLPMHIVLQRIGRWGQGATRIGVHYEKALPPPSPYNTPLAIVRAEPDGGLRLAARHDRDVFLDGRPVPRKVALQEGHILRAGHHAVQLGRVDVPTGADEAAFLDSLDEAVGVDDDALRAVYADWLEVAGRHACAAFLRRPELDAADLRDASRDVPSAWRVRVGRFPIERCPGRRGCPQRWDRLARSPEPAARDCATCAETVRFCPDASARPVSKPAKGPIVVDPALGLDADAAGF
jgi:uncharacterized protein (TIGR02996 family)